MTVVDRPEQNHTPFTTHLSSWLKRTRFNASRSPHRRPENMSLSHKSLFFPIANVPSWALPTKESSRLLTNGRPNSRPTTTTTSFTALRRNEFPQEWTGNIASLPTLALLSFGLESKMGIRVSWNLFSTQRPTCPTLNSTTTTTC